MADAYDPSNVVVGPGRWFYADEPVTTTNIGTAEPADLATPLPSAFWKAGGFTKEGSEWAFESTLANIMVNERQEPVGMTREGLSVAATLAMAETTLERLRLALGGGTITGGSGESTFEPPTGPTIDYRAIAWEDRVTDDGTPTERIIVRRISPSTGMTIQRQKGENYSAFTGVTLKSVDPGGGLPVFKLWSVRSAANT